VACAEALTAALEAFSRSPSSYTSVLVLALPKLNLDSLPRGGRSHLRHAATLIHRRLELWRTGQFSLLWNQRLPGSFVGSSTSGAHASLDSPLSESLRKAVMLAVTENNPGKGARLLFSNSAPAPDAPATLQALNPAGPEAAPAPVPAEPVVELSTPTSGRQPYRLPRVPQRAHWAYGRFTCGRCWCPGPLQCRRAILYGFGDHIMSYQLPTSNFQLELRNVFDSLERAVFLPEIRAKAPVLSPFADWCSCITHTHTHTHTPLFTAQGVIRSCQGVQQGDPLGFLFAFFSVGTLSLAHLARRCFQWGVWFLDDAHLMGTPAQVSHALTELLPALEHHGLSLNWKKSRVRGDASLFPTGSLLHRLSHVSLSDGLTVLGSYVGPLTEGCEHFLERLYALECPRTAFLLLRSCLGVCKLTHTARTIPFAHPPSLFRLCSGRLSQCLGSPMTPHLVVPSLHPPLPGRTRNR